MLRIKKEFLEILAEIIGSVLLGEKNNSSEVQDKMRTYYFSLSEEQQLFCLQETARYVGDNAELQIYIFSYLLWLLNDKKIVRTIEKILESENELTLLDKINASAQLKSYVFINNVAMPEEERNRLFRTLYRSQLGKVLEELNQEILYIPYERRNHNRIILLIEPMLGTRHAPTKKMINIYYYLQQLGYDVYVYATNYRLIQYSKFASWWQPSVTNSLFEENAEFCLDYYGVKVRGYYALYAEDNFFETIREIREEIRQLNPAFVLTIGDNNFLGDSCDSFTDVVTMGCTNAAPITASRMVAQYFFEKIDNFQAYLDSNQIMIDYIHTEQLEEPEEAEYTRNNLEIGKNDFVIVIAGHRLDDEIKQDTVDMLQVILERESMCKVLFIGDCVELQKKLWKHPFRERFRIVGETKNFRSTIALGDLFLNPPRKGGGTGALYAVQSGIPVLTLGNCDVANIGEKFVCDKLEDMPEIVHRYIFDKEFMNSQKEYCKEQLQNIGKIDNIAQTRKFCEEVEYNIKRKEEKGTNRLEKRKCDAGEDFGDTEFDAAF